MSITIPQMPIKTVTPFPGMGVMAFDDTNTLIVKHNDNQYTVEAADFNRSPNQTAIADKHPLIMGYRITSVTPIGNTPAPTRQQYQTDLLVSAIMAFTLDTADTYNLTYYIKNDGKQRIYLNSNSGDDHDNPNIIYEYIVENDENGDMVVKYNTHSKNDLFSLYQQIDGTPLDDPYVHALVAMLLHAAQYWTDQNESAIPF